MTGLFKPRQGEEWYYKLKTPSVHHEWALSSTFIQPWFPPSDPTHGRGDLPFSPRETAIRGSPAYIAWDGKAYLDDNNSEWIFYQVRPLPCSGSSETE